MWFPELFERTEDGGSPCANVSRPSVAANETCNTVKTAGVFQRIHAHISVFIGIAAHGGQEISFNIDRSQFLQYLERKRKANIWNLQQVQDTSALLFNLL